MEDQLSALGFVLNCVVLWNTVYKQPRPRSATPQAYPVLGADAERLSAFILGHTGIDGHYASHLPDLGGAHRPLLTRTPATTDAVQRRLADAAAFTGPFGGHGRR